MDWHTVIATDYPLAVRLLQRDLPTSLKSTHDAEDFVQQAVCQLLIRPIEYHGLITLITIARRRMIDAIRKPRPEHLETDQADTSPTASDQAEAAELLERLLDRTDGLAREIIQLRAEGHTPQEIALLIGRTVRTVQRFFKLFKSLHEPY